MEMNWIKCSDRLPIDQATVKNYDTKNVIAATRFGDVFPAEYSCGNVGEPWHKFDGCVDGYVTHWMEMPAPPED